MALSLRLRPAIAGARIVATFAATENHDGKRRAGRFPSLVTLRYCFLAGDACSSVESSR